MKMANITWLVIVLAIKIATAEDIVDINSNVIFKKEGKVASGVSHIYTSIPVNLTNFHETATIFKHTLEEFKSEKKMMRKYSKVAETSLKVRGFQTVDNHQEKALKYTLKKWQAIANTYIPLMEELIQRVEHLSILLPGIQIMQDKESLYEEVDKANDGLLKEATEKVLQGFSPKEDFLQDGLIELKSYKGLVRHKRFIEIILMAILIPLFMAGVATSVAAGIVDSQNKDELKDQHWYSEKQKKEIDNVFSMLLKTDNKINDILASITEMQVDQFLENKLSPTIVGANLGAMVNVFSDALNRIQSAVDMAQNRRLSTKYLPEEKLREIFQRHQELAKRHDMDLLIQDHTDLHHIEVKQYYDHTSLHIVLCVPMVPAHYLLDLYTFYTVPLPYYGDSLLVPQSTHELYATSNGSLSWSLTSKDLIDCDKFEDIYLCQKLTVLERGTGTKCIGLLFANKLEEAKHVCDFKIMNDKEYVTAIPGNIFMVYSPKSYTTQAVCTNGTQFPIVLARGKNILQMHHGCHAELISAYAMGNLPVSPTAFNRPVKVDFQNISLFKNPTETFIPQWKALQVEGRKVAYTSQLTSMAVEAEIDQEPIFKMDSRLSNISMSTTFYAIIALFTVQALGLGYCCCRKSKRVIVKKRSSNKLKRAMRERELWVMAKQLQMSRQNEIEG